MPRLSTAAARYGVGIVATIAAVVLRWLLDPGLGEHLPLVTLFGGVAVAVWIGGVGPAVLSSVAGFLACEYLFSEPRGSIAFQDPRHAVGLVAYLVSCGIIIAFGEGMNSAGRQAFARAQELQVTLQSIGDAVIATDTAGRIVTINPVAQALTKWSASDAIGQPLDAVFRIVDERTRHPAELPVARVLREGVVVGLANHTVLLRRDGSEIPIDDSAAPMRDKRGRIVGCVLIFRDITERRRQERALEQSEHDLRDFFDNATVGLHWVGPDGIVRRANDAELHMLGYDCEEYVGRHIAEFHADQSVIGDILRRLADGEELENFPAQMRCKDGSLRDVLINSNVLWEDGKFIHTRCFTRDVTNLKRAQRAQAHLAALVAASDDAIISKSLDGVIQTWNAGAEALFGYPAEEAIGRNITLIIPPERAGEEEQIRARLRAGERISHFDTVRMRRDGQRIDISVTISPIIDEAGALIAASKIARDITAEKATEKRIYDLLAQLRQTDAQKDEFLATLAHELRGPLAPIRNALELLRRRGSDPAVLADASKTMDRQLSQMERLIEDLLDVSRISRNKIELRKQDTELVDVISQAVESCRSVAERFGVVIDVSLPDEPVPLHADRARLVQVFTNLLNNACKYSKPGGRVRVDGRVEHGRVTVCVKDKGIGIPQEMLPRVFEMFTQVDRSLERSQDGLGIGLALVRRLVLMHDGSVEGFSEGVDRGSEFVVRLPIAKEYARGAPAPEPGLPTASVAPRRILVVDDNIDSATTLARLLKISGHVTQTAHDGPDAIALAEQFRPDAILLDIGLPKLSGHEVCRSIRNKLWGRDTVIVALTGWGQEEDRRKSRDAGFSAHLVKPVDFESLMTILADSTPVEAS